MSDDPVAEALARHDFTEGGMVTRHVVLWTVENIDGVRDNWIDAPDGQDPVDTLALLMFGEIAAKRDIDAGFLVWEDDNEED